MTAATDQKPLELRSVELTHFGAFRECTFSWGPGLNLVTGTNGTGKTHLLRLIAAGFGHWSGMPFGQGVRELFLGPGEPVSRLLFRDPTVREGVVAFRMDRGFWSFRLGDSGRRPMTFSVQIQSGLAQLETRFPRAFLFPLGIAPWLPSGGKPCPGMKPMVARIEKSMPGRVVTRGKELRVSNTRGEIGISLVTPVVRQLGFLSLLLRRGLMAPGSILLWDIPEADAGPTFMGVVAELLLSLQRSGIQVIVATRDYVLLKEIDLQRQSEDDIRYHSLYRDEREDRIRVSESDDFSGMAPNPASEAFRSLFDRDVERALSKKGPL